MCTCWFAVMFAFPPPHQPPFSHVPLLSGSHSPPLLAGLLVCTHQLVRASCSFVPPTLVCLMLICLPLHLFIPPALTLCSFVPPPSFVVVTAATVVLHLPALPLTSLLVPMHCSPLLVCVCVCQPPPGLCSHSPAFPGLLVPATGPATVAVAATACTCTLPLIGPLVRVCPFCAHPLFYLWYIRGVL